MFYPLKDGGIIDHRSGHLKKVVWCADQFVQQSAQNSQHSMVNGLIRGHESRQQQPDVFAADH